ncbi:MAG: helix-turn-helix transcriptional regulator [Coriobacteriales bacterium]|jgi:DNA-binding PadR family transcriptional regulator|nr:helix-turn-helix transcriptional regulator [Coriobacteriales bacterium]
MTHLCNPKADNDLKACSQLAKSLSRLSQPTVLTVLATSDEPLHGYAIVQRAAESPMFGGAKPDPTGIYRLLKQMEDDGLVTSQWETPKAGPAKRAFTLTEVGRTELRRWIDSLACYTTTINELRDQASCALGIETPPIPECSAH